MIEHNRCIGENCSAFISGDDQYCNSCVRAENNRRMREARGYMAFSDIMEANGKTIHENRSAQEHKYPVGTLVEVQREEWEGDGACEIATSRMWVVEHNRDCDGTPLYSLSFHRPQCLLGPGRKKDKVLLYYPEMEVGGPDYRAPGGLSGTFFNEEFSRKQLEKWRTGYPEESLTPIEVTQEIKDGRSSLKHPLQLSKIPFRPEMLCESCSAVTTFVHVEEHKGPRPDWRCTDCGWCQTSTEGGYCEVLTSWLQDDGKGVTLHVDKEQLGEYIFRSCQGEYGQHYAEVFAEELLSLLKRLQENK